ncbi:4Fe-4S binding protein [Acidianus brierleyi]|uniref:4Fe-4S ferredoxin n=1 Tax=Acidianus brierleyi TaxID=41673 RepID=A0A2U9ICK6_9CREN|nr:4Fe-4S binding protein [Acidianus brierleyi]AWR93752.1 4Fe-4S dicluster domain-containing protein [Acidianus brierleyi]
MNKYLLSITLYVYVLSLSIITVISKFNGFYILLALGIISEISNGLLFNYLYKTRNLEKQNLGEVYFLNISMLIAFSGILSFYLFLNEYLSISIILLSTVFILIQNFYKIKGNYIKSAKISFSLLLLVFTTTWVLATDISFGSGMLNFGVNNFITEAAGLGILDIPIISFLYNSFSVLVGIISTVWFSIMFGIFFLPLTIHRIISAKKLENKIRYTLMILAYWIYSTYIPSFSPISDKVQYLPYMWFNGLGTYGPVSSSYLLSGIVGTYIVTAILSYMFGSRQICSVTCTAPYMLQGSFMYSLKDYNRTSKLGRKTLGSKVSWWYKINSTIIMGSLIFLAIISFLNQEGVTNISILGIDPTVYICLLYFDLLWYIQFLIIPFIGNYSCVTSGICQWGIANQVFSYLGPFKLKVKDSNACLNCKTVDCAKACPVGITDMRGSFIKKGELKSFKCIGAGDCIESCPENNIYIYDIRKMIKDRIKI